MSGRSTISVFVRRRNHLYQDLVLWKLSDDTEMSDLSDQDNFNATWGNGKVRKKQKKASCTGYYVWCPAVVSRGVFQGSLGLTFIRSYFSVGFDNLDSDVHRNVTFLHNHEFRHWAGGHQEAYAKYRVFERNRLLTVTR